MAWSCMLARGTGSLVFTDDITADKSSRMLYSVLRFGTNAAKLIRKRFTVQKIFESSESETLNIFQ